MAVLSTNRSMPLLSIPFFVLSVMVLLAAFLGAGIPPQNGRTPVKRSIHPRMLPAAQQRLTSVKPFRKSASVQDYVGPAVDSKYWVPNNNVNAIIVDDAHDLIYLGGNFDYIGPVTGCFAALDPVTATMDNAFPSVLTVQGSVDAIIPDGSGGVYIGGSFSQVGVTPINNLAHILSNGSVDNTWNPNPDNAVQALALSGNSLIVGGSFSSIGGGTDGYLSSVSVATGLMDTTWTSPSIGSSVTTVCVYGGTIYFGGYFTTVGDSTRKYLAAVDLDGNIKSWNPAPFGEIVEIGGIDAANGFVYVGGSFTKIGSLFANSLAKLDTIDGTAAAWDPVLAGSLNLYCSSVKVSGERVYIGGTFTAVGDSTRYGIAAVDTGTALATAWSAGLDSTGYVQSLLVDGAQVYFSGDFSTVKGSSRLHLATVDTSGTLQSWSATTSEAAYALCASGGKIFVGGQMYSFGGVRRVSVAALSEITGHPNGLQVSFDDTEPQVTALALSDTTLFVGGSFHSVGGFARSSLVAVGASSGGVLPFDANLSAASWSYTTDAAQVFALKTYGGALYVGGQFDSAGTGPQVPRNNMAAFDLSTGALRSWNANVQSGLQPTVNAILCTGGRVYIGGAFASVGDSTRRNLAAVDTVNGLATSWSPSVPNTNDYIYSLAAEGARIYIGGSFSMIDSVARGDVAAVDTSDGTSVFSWNPNPGSSVEAITLSGSSVYLGGWFSSVGGQPYTAVGAVDKTNGTAVSWNVSLDQTPVQALGISTKYQEIAVGGGFAAVMSSSQPYFVVVTNPSDGSLPVEMLSCAATARSNAVTLTWTTATESNNYGFRVERRRIADPQSISAGAWEARGFVPGAGTSSTPHQYQYIDAGVEPGSYVYRLEQIDRSGASRFSQEMAVDLGAAPREFALGQNYPNPFNPTTTITFTVPSDGRATLKVYDIVGREVATLVDQPMKAGILHQVTFDASRVASGMYFARLQFGTRTLIRKMMLIK